MKTIRFVLQDDTPPIELVGPQGGYTVTPQGPGYVSGWVSDGQRNKTVIVPFDRLAHLTFEDTDPRK